ncbi:MAG: Tripartite-type tricarboxylate transporter, receptor component TctC [Hyphomicrobiales bacterium]|nr:Tripartite-type tricarboxylate transporter, receptor component TctC [Hyphomicrobiales bacterium]
MIRFQRTPSTAAWLGAGLALALAASPAAAQQSVADFYKGKTIDFYIGFSVGGGYDLYARTVARFIGEHIPGKPRVIPRNMTGAGSRVAANYVYTVAPKDGTVLATADQSIPLEQAVGDKGIQFDSRNFFWIGNPIVDNNTLVTWHTSPVKTVEDARQREIAIGATGFNTSSQYPQVMNQLVGTKFKIIMGYPGGNEVNLAMENGEVAGRGSNSWASWKASKPDWVRDKKLNILVQIGLSKSPDLPDVPLLVDLARNDEDRAALRLVSAPPNVGRPIFTTPGVPAERVKALRDAFDATMKDPAFLEEARKTGLDINPISGVELQKVVSDIIDTPKAVTERLASILSLIEREKK